MFMPPGTACCGRQRRWVTGGTRAECALPALDWRLYVATTVQMCFACCTVVQFAVRPVLRGFHPLHATPMLHRAMPGPGSWTMRTSKELELILGPKHNNLSCGCNARLIQGPATLSD